MRDSNQAIRYLGFQSTTNGGRRLQFSVDSATQTPVSCAITISGSFFTGSEGISFQEATRICCTKLRTNLDAGTLRTATSQMDLTDDDIAQFRETPRRRRRS